MESALLGTLALGTAVVLYGVYSRGAPGHLAEEHPAPDLGWLHLVYILLAWLVWPFVFLPLLWMVPLPGLTADLFWRSVLAVVATGVSLWNSLWFLRASNRLDVNLGETRFRRWVERPAFALPWVTLFALTFAVFVVPGGDRQSVENFSKLLYSAAAGASVFAALVYGWGLIKTFAARGFHVFIVPWVVGLLLQLAFEAHVLAEIWQGTQTYLYLPWVKGVAPDGFWLYFPSHAAWAIVNASAKILICLSLVAQAVSWMRARGARLAVEASVASSVSAVGTSVGVQPNSEGIQPDEQPAVHRPSNSEAGGPPATPPRTGVAAPLPDAPPARRNSLSLTGDELRSWREALGLSRQQVVDQSRNPGFTPVSISSIQGAETGFRSVKPETLQAIIKVLGFFEQRGTPGSGAADG